MIRDGGSLAATFEIEGPREFILFIPIAETLRAWAEPVLIDPEKRLNGASVPVPWAQARMILAEMTGLTAGLGAQELALLQQMTQVAAYDGRPPALGP